MAKKIETATDVVEWANSVVEAKGEKFTALSKGEQFVIAKYIVANADGKAEEPKDEGVREAPDPDELGTPSRTPVCPPNPLGEMLAADVNPFPQDELGTPPRNPVCPPNPLGEMPAADVNLFPQAPTATTVTMTRGYVYHQMGLDAQQTFDKFLAWGKDHPKEMSVMDFSTGRKSTDAAFAYWLNEIMSVNIPHKI